MKDPYTPFTKAGKLYTQGSLADGIKRWGHGYTNLDIVEDIEKEAVLTAAGDLLTHFQDLINEMQEEINTGWAELYKVTLEKRGSGI